MRTFQYSQQSNKQREKPSFYLTNSNPYKKQGLAKANSRPPKFLTESFSVAAIPGTLTNTEFTTFNNI